MKVINKIKKLIIEYEKEQELSNIVNMYEKLALYSIFLAEQLSEYKNSYNSSYYKRKISISHSYLNNKAEKITDKLALEKANIENEELLKQELELESITIRLDNFLKQVNKILEAQRTKISYLKSEKERLNKDNLL